MMTVYKILEEINENIDEVLSSVKTDLQKVDCRIENIKQIEIQYVSLARHYCFLITYAAPTVHETCHFIFFTELHNVLSNKQLFTLITQLTYNGRVFLDYVNRRCLIDSYDDSSRFVDKSGK